MMRPFGFFLFRANARQYAIRGIVLLPICAATTAATIATIVNPTDRPWFPLFFPLAVLSGLAALRCLHNAVVIWWAYQRFFWSRR